MSVSFSCVQLLRCCTPGASTGFRSLSSGEEPAKPAELSARDATTTDLPTSPRWNFGEESSDGSFLGDGVTTERKKSGLPENSLTPARTKSLENGRLLDEYALGALLGQGSFGIVFACRQKSEESDQDDRAVKLVDKVEALPEDIAREVKTQQMLNHPNILKIHEVIHEKCFLCIITDRLWGGDLVKCIKSHVSAGKRIRIGKILHVVRQMLQAIVYLHELSIVHRDIKADNFLLDRVSLMDSRCRAVLADFGFACECKLGDRLRRRCGTRAYWPPELWDRNYTRKVDVWAMGVTLFCIVEGHFPFSSEWEVKHKEVSCHPMLSEKCADLVQQLLNKVEAIRVTASQALAHKWLNVQVGREDTGGGECDIEWKANGEMAIDLDGPDPAVAARRLELVERLEGMHMQKRLGAQSSEGSGKRNAKITKMNWNTESSLDSANATPLSILKNPTFHVVDKLADKIRTFEWRPRAFLESLSLLNFTDGNTGINVALPKTDHANYSNVVAVGQMLEAHGINTSAFGQGSAKTLERFAEEIESGASQLMMDAAKHKALVRVVDVVLLRLDYIGLEGEPHYLIVAADEQLDGRVRSDLNRLPGTKKKPHENVRNAAERIVMETPDVDVDSVTFAFDAMEVFEEDEESPSYPGVRTVYRKQLVPGHVDAKTVSQGMDSMKPVTSHKSSRSTKFFSWLTDEECEAKQVKLWAPKQGTEVSSLVPAPIGLKVKALGRFLKASKIDPSAFGKDRTKTLQELSTEMITGESSLMSLPGGGVVRIVDVVLLMVSLQGTDSVLVVTKETSASSGGSEAQLNRLPGTKRRPDESHFHAAKRVLQRQLKINENFINLDAENVQLFEEEKESPSYPGLRTVYCKRIITAELQVTPQMLAKVATQNSTSIATEGRPQTLNSSMINHALALYHRFV